MTPTPLNPRQLKFVEVYLATGNATQAYIAAGYNARGRSAENAASRLLGNAGVREAVAKAREAASSRQDLTAEWVLARLRKEAEREGEGASHAARVAALKLLGLALGMFSEKHEHTGPGGGPIRHDHTVSVTAEDVALARAVLGAAGGGVHPDGGPEPVVGPPPAAPEAAGVPVAGRGA